MKPTAADIISLVKEKGLAVNSDGIVEDTQLFTDRVVDSLGAVVLIQELSQRYGIRIDVNKLTPQNFNSPSQMANFLISQDSH